MSTRAIIICAPLSFLPLWCPRPVNHIEQQQQENQNQQLQVHVWCLGGQAAHDFGVRIGEDEREHDKKNRVASFCLPGRTNKPVAFGRRQRSDAKYMEAHDCLHRLLPNNSIGCLVSRPKIIHLCARVSRSITWAKFTCIGD